MTRRADAPPSSSALDAGSDLLTHLCSEAPSLRNVCGSVITYQPDPSFPVHFRPLMSALPRWVIVDNASNENARRSIGALVSDRVELIQNRENLGVASALNQAARRAIDLGFEWLLTFDQDSRPAGNMLEELFAAYETCAAIGPVGMLGSNFWAEGMERPFFACQDCNAKAQEQPTLITSGSLLSLRAFSSVGPFRDDLFIDGVDTEYCLRLRAAGFVVAVTREPLMEHSLGQLRTHRLLWKHPAITHHTALRRYYITRNGLVILKQYRESDPAWAKFMSNVLVKSSLGILLFEEDKLRKLGAVAVAALDALRGRMGKATYPWLRA